MTAPGYHDQPLELLVVDDNPGDVRLVIEALRESKTPKNIHVAKDGVQAMEFLRHRAPSQGSPRPDLIFLDLNLPRKDGREVLGEIKSSAELKNIPVVVLTTSGEEADVTRSYNLHANCYITKPVDFDHFIRAVQILEQFWLNLVRLPRLELLR